MRSASQVGLSVAILLLGCRALSAQPIDCERLKSTRIPFQVTLVTDAYAVAGPDGTPVTTPARTTVLQVYRNDDGWMVIYGAEEDGKNPFRTESRYGLFRTNEPLGTPAYRLTRTYAEESASDLRGEGRSAVVRARQVFKAGSTQTERDFETTYTFLRTEGLFVGPCRFTVNLYDVEIKSTADGKTETTFGNRVWYSPELMLSLATDDRRPIKAAPPITVHSAAVKIETDFKPLAQ